MEEKMILKSVGSLKVIQKIKFDGGCPLCGDSIQTVESMVPCHGEFKKIYIGWCMDCLEIKGFYLLR